jgi:hypothetical protein
VQLDLPEFDPSKNFTMSAWILGGTQGGNAVPLSIECIEESRSLVALVSWDRQDIFHVIRRTSRAPVAKTSPVETLISSHVKFKQEEWMHLSYMEQDGRMLLYMNGVMAASGSLPAIEHDTVTRVGTHNPATLGPSLKHTPDTTMHRSSFLGKHDVRPMGWCH